MLFQPMEGIILKNDFHTNMFTRDSRPLEYDVACFHWNIDFNTKAEFLSPLCLISHLPQRPYYILQDRLCRVIEFVPRTYRVAIEEFRSVYIFSSFAN